MGRGINSIWKGAPNSPVATIVTSSNVLVNVPSVEINSLNICILKLYKSLI